jgi:hypothetical protein
VSAAFDHVAKPEDELEQLIAQRELEILQLTEVRARHQARPTYAPDCDRPSAPDNTPNAAES